MDRQVGMDDTRWEYLGDALLAGRQRITQLEAEVLDIAGRCGDILAENERLSKDKEMLFRRIRELEDDFSAIESLRQERNALRAANMNMVADMRALRRKLEERE